MNPLDWHDFSEKKEIWDLDDYEAKQTQNVKTT